MAPASRCVYAYPAAERPAYTIGGAYIYEYPHGPAVFVALGGVWYDCTAPCEPRFRVRGGLVYAYPGGGRPRYVIAGRRPARLPRSA